MNIDKNKFVKSLFIRNLNKKENFEIIFNKSIIFCAGGLGNPNILQNLLKDYNQLIGKKLSDHPHINLGALKVKEAKSSFRFSKYFINKSEENIEQNLYYRIDSYFVGVQLDFISDPARYLKRAFVRARFLLPKLVISILIKYYSFFFKLVIAILSILNLKGKYSYEFFFSQNQSLDNMININRQIKESGDYQTNFSYDKRQGCT